MLLKKAEVKAALDAAKKDAKYHGVGYIKVKKDGTVENIPYMNSYRDNKETRMKIRGYQEEIKRLKNDLEAWRNSRP